MEIGCVNIFKIKYEKELIDIDEFTKKCNSKKINPIDEIKKSLFIYNKKEYTYNKYEQDLSETYKQFETISNADIEIMLSCDFVSFYSKELYSCYMFLNGLYSNMYAGYYYATNSYEKLPKIWRESEKYIGVFLRRNYDFSTSLFWYDTLIDYILQVFCTKFSLYKLISKRKNVDKMSFEELIKECDYTKINKYMSTIKESEENKKIFRWWNKIAECSSKLYWIRDTTNSLKHRTNICSKNLDFGSCVKYIKNNKEENLFSRPNVDIDKDFYKLIDAHNNVMILFKFIINEINQEFICLQDEINKKYEEKK